MYGFWRHMDLSRRSGRPYGPVDPEVIPVVGIALIFRYYVELLFLGIFEFFDHLRGSGPLLFHFADLFGFVGHR